MGLGPNRTGHPAGITQASGLKPQAQAGGAGKFASQVVEVHRDVEGEKEILSFDLSQIRKGRLADPAIESGDVVFVKRRFF